jgi:hypothetical protein
MERMLRVTRGCETQILDETYQVLRFKRAMCAIFLPFPIRTHIGCAFVQEAW